MKDGLSQKRNFWAMVRERELNVKMPLGKISQWARDLAERITVPGESPPYDPETLRKYISQWIDESG